MTIGIDASRAFLRKRTGIEEYAYQVIRHLREELASEQVVLYVRKKISLSVIPAQAGIQSSGFSVPFWIPGQARDDRKKIGIFFTLPEIDFELPENWRVRGIWAPRFWTQIGLSLEMLFHRPDVLFVPAHTVPLIHPKRTIVTVHGLEYEFCPGAYSWWDRLYMRCSIRFSCRAAETVVCVSENTKRDVEHLYNVSSDKIKVIYEGYSACHSERSEESRNIQICDTKNEIPRQARDDIKKPYLLFIGRLEERKNIVRIIEAFEILKEKYKIPHELVLAGKPGYGYERIRSKIQDSRFKIQIKEVGYVSEEEKWNLLKNADVFLFPTLYEGFGIPVLEAQSAGVAVVTSCVSSLPEVGGEGAVYADPSSAESIAEGAWRILSDKGFRDDIILKGKENAKRFSWAQCSGKISKLFF